uniref:Uncharacterized protein n=1 Tax=Arundo donax TaxID=35708 RepID=A0A0A8ZXA5_ARUDO
MFLVFLIKHARDVIHYHRSNGQLGTNRRRMRDNTACRLYAHLFFLVLSWLKAAFSNITLVVGG